MTKVKRGVLKHKNKKILKLVKGYRFKDLGGNL